MKILKSIAICFMMFIIFSCSKENNLESVMKDAMKGLNGSVVFIDIDSGKTISTDPKIIKEQAAPCSTFKIWNTLIGIESNMIHSADEPFYKWDGVKRFFDAWNKDQTLKEAFRVSCVPAYQALARKIGSKNMYNWLKKINYGNQDITSGIDIFWLPRDGKKPILISPEEQARLIRDLVNGKLPFSEKAMNILKEIMTVKSTCNGTLYGKTGSGKNINGEKDNNIGWFVGYITAGEHSYSFACFIKGKNISGKDSKMVIENILQKSRLL